MPLDRRQLLQYSPSFLLASSFPLLATSALAARDTMVAALLVPQTGPNAALGRSMERAAMLAQAGNKATSLLVLDTGGTPQGAAAATKAARKQRASVILGPLRSQEVPAVVASAGQIPVITFSNDTNLRESGAFMLGITARQSVSAILGYAASRGIRRIAVGGLTGEWAAQVRAASVAESTALGISIAEFAVSNPTVIPNTFAGSEDGLPDAVLMANSAELTRLMPQLIARNIQPLAALPELDLTSQMVEQLDGTWVAAPDPTVFARFASAFEQRMGTRPGIIAGLAFDASNIVNTMRLGGGLDRSAVLSASGFNGVCGRVRFRENGSASRDLAVLELANRAIKKVAG